jgi:pimeloyl-ACP methyl ester carboxylesterase
VSRQRTHHVITSDGVSLGATVHGQGPPLVLLHGIENDGDLCWREILPHLTERFTCHLLDNRGRGLSGDHPNLSISRLAQDVVEYVASLGEPAGLVGESFGGNLALIAAARSEMVDAIVPFEPAIMILVDEEEAVMGEAIAGMTELAEEGDLVAAARAFAGWFANDDEIVAVDRAGLFEAAGRYVPNLLNLLDQAMEGDGPKVDDAAMLGTISAPVLVVRGSDTRPFFADSARFVVDHTPKANLYEIRGAGHVAALTHPEALAEAITEFVLTARQSGDETHTSTGN